MGLIDDIRFAFRMFRREPGFTLGALLALALSIGANTSVFAVVKSVLLNPLAMSRPEELAAVWSSRPDGARWPFNIPNFLDLKARTRAFADMAAYGGWNANLSGDAEPERLLGVRATGNYFQMIGIQALIGRTLEPADDLPDHPKVVVITHGLWQRRFGSDPGVIGRQARLNNDSYTIVGVLPPSFSFRNANMEIASALAPDLDPFRSVRSSTSFLRAFGRLRPGTTLEQAREDMTSLSKDLKQEFPKENAGIVGIEVIPLQEEVTENSRLMLVVLMSAVGFVLLIACANISSLMIAKAAARQKELAIRAALGGTRSRLTRQLLAESTLLALIGGALGVMIAYRGVPLLLNMSPAGMARSQEVKLDWSVVLIGLVVSGFCGVVLGTIPALQASRRDVNESLRTDGRGATAGTARGTMRSVLVVAEVALSLMLLTGAGLLLKSFYRMTSANPGYDAQNLITFRLALPGTRYASAQSIAVFRDELKRRIESIPAVRSVGATSILPLSGPIASIDFTIDGRPFATQKEKPTTQYRMVDAGYFKTMGIPLLRGRGFEETDTGASQLVVVVSQALAAAYWRDQNPVGARIRLEDDVKGPRDAIVVGVSGPVRELAPDQPPTICLFVPMKNIATSAVRFVTNNMFWVVRGTGSNVTRSIRSEIRAVDADVAAVEAPMAQYIDRAEGTRRFSLQILGVFAVAALVLAAGGIYALVSYATAQRAREIGIRMALGAQPWGVAGMVLRQGMILAAIGAVIGTAGALGLSRFIKGMLYEVGENDPMTIGAVVALLLVIAGLASFAPASRAMRGDPAQTLR